MNIYVVMRQAGDLGYYFDQAYLDVALCAPYLWERLEPAFRVLWADSSTFPLDGGSADVEHWL